MSIFYRVYRGGSLDLNYFIGLAEVVWAGISNGWKWEANGDEGWGRGDTPETAICDYLRSIEHHRNDGPFLAVLTSEGVRHR